MARLNAQELAKALQSLPEWSGEGGEIRRAYQFPGFMAAIGFVNRAAQLAESANHHPDIDIRYNKVLVALSTHDEGGVTEKDVALATKLDAAVGD